MRECGNNRRRNFILLLSILIKQSVVSGFLSGAPSTTTFAPCRSTWSFQTFPRKPLELYSKNNSKEESNKWKQGKDSASTPNKKNKKELDKEEKKQVIAKAAAKLLGKGRRDLPEEETKKEGLLDLLDPFKAGKKVRKTIDTALSTLGSKGLSEERRSIYYLDDRFTDQGGPGGALFSERNPLFDRIAGNDYVPEVLVVGATGEVGRLVVRRLLIDGRFRVRVLVRNLYSKTLNMLGTGVTYCQGDLSKVESLEYAVTDADKIVFCANAPRPDEADFQDRFQEFVDETLEEEDDEENADKTKNTKKDTDMSDKDWLELESVLELRSKLAEQVDYVGMQNLVRAYQNVRFADYGTSQAAKRSLFKFGSRAEDFNLFAIDREDHDEEEEDADEQEMAAETSDVSQTSYDDTSYNKDENYDSYAENDDAYYAAMAEKYDDTNDPYSEYEKDMDEEYAAAATRKAGTATEAQCKWVRNDYGNGVFVGKVPAGSTGGGGEAAVVSSRLRSREDPEAGIDLSNGFGGFVCRVCGDGGNYQAFVRTGSYASDGIEYVCEFSTKTKPFRRGNKSKNKFMTLRLDFANFTPVQRQGGEDTVVPPFRGQDLRQIGFRYRSVSNCDENESDEENKELKDFYLALSYIKVYRSQPEPEFIYLSDARIPPVVKSNMVQHRAKRLVTDVDSTSDDDGTYRILDEAEIKRRAQDMKDRSSEETYYKYRGEEILKNSGLSYAILRVAGYNELPTADASTVELQSSNTDITSVSRGDVAEVCASALLDPSALNKSFYISKATSKSRVEIDDNLSNKFKDLPADSLA